MKNLCCLFLSIGGRGFGGGGRCLDDAGIMDFGIVWGGDAGVEVAQDCFTGGLRTDLAFPYPDHSPAGELKVDSVGIVACHVHGNLVFPEVYVRLRQTEMAASLMAVPETAVDENDCPVFLEDNVGRSRQLPVVDAIAQTTGEKILPDDHLRLRILSLDGRHAAASLLRCHNVCHVSVCLLLIHTVFSLFIYITHRGFVHCPPDAGSRVESGSLSIRQISS